MTNETERVYTHGLFLQALTLIFVTLKLLGTISWSWWWVLAPLWGPVAVFLPVGIFALFMAWFTGQLGTGNRLR